MTSGRRLAPLVMKAMERVIKSHIITPTDPLMDPLQFAYCAGRGVDDATTSWRWYTNTWKSLTPQPDCCLQTSLLHSTPYSHTSLQINSPPADPVDYRIPGQQITEGAGQ